MDRIDVHAHFVPPEYRDECIRTGNGQPDGMPALPKWDVEAHLDLMEKNHISKSILSISSPGTYLSGMDPSQAAKLTIYCNNYSASLKKQYPGKFGFWASLPLPDVELSLQEIERALDLGADGFCLLTNSRGYYLGDKAFDRVFDELNRRRATVFVHPTTPCMRCGSDMSECVAAAPLAGQFPNPVFEFMFDTTRMIINMFSSGTVGRCPNITFIMPHLGGAMPPLLSRFTGFSAIVPGMMNIAQEDVSRKFNEQFFFDLAGFPFPTQIVGLVDGVGVTPNRLLYGSDFPFTPAVAVQKLAERLDSGLKSRYNAKEIGDILVRNAEMLLEGGHSEG